MSETDLRVLARRVVAAAGGVAKLARPLNISTQAISQWSRVPVEHVIAIERLTGIPRHEIRPDIYPPEPERAA